MSALVGCWGGCAVALLQVLLVWDNLRVFAPPRVAAATEASGLVSVLVPARNEACVIAACVRSLLAQTHGALEVLVLDDGSEDGTAASAAATAAGDPRFHCWRGVPLPSGWAGKPHACAQLAARARGEWLCFVDADTRLGERAIAQALAVAEAREADLLSFWPRQVMGSFVERWLLPLMSFLLLAFLPLRLVSARGSWPIFAAANGQCLLFRRAAYVRCGGHAARPDDWVEDMGIARGIKASGGRVVLVDAGAEASCRMYRSGGELWRGFRKNLYPAFGGRPLPFLAGLGVVGGLHVLPWVALPLAWGLGRGELLLPLGLWAACGLVMRALLAARLGHPGWSVWGHGAAVAAMLVLGLDSWRGHALGTVRWKGRAAVREGLS